MSIIYYRGLNCHLAGFINIADRLGIEYHQAFADLWSETDFTYDQNYYMYLSQRVYTNLELLGLSKKPVDCTSPDIIKRDLSGIDEKGLLLIGMDSFDIPWSRVYQHFHEPHYFYAEKLDADHFFSYDPVYDKQDIMLKADHIYCHAFEVSMFKNNGTKVLRPDLLHEAEMIQNHLPTLRDKLLLNIQNSAKEGNTDIKMLIRLITAMINNRYLFKEYLALSYHHVTEHKGIFDAEFFQKWEAVKNGLYKIQILKNKETIIPQAVDLLRELIAEELNIADRLPDLV